MKRINLPDKKIITIEDPVEYQMDGINQIHVNAQIGLTFAAGLRHIVRQDPDVIMIGEIRDLETAEIAIRSALTGHLVFSTLHTNDAPSALATAGGYGCGKLSLASCLVEYWLNDWFASFARIARWNIRRYRTIGHSASRPLLQGDRISSVVKPAVSQATNRAKGFSS
jgi:hypothetical protein